MERWERFSEDELREFVKNSTSLHQVALKCGYGENSGSSNPSIKKMIKKYGFSTDHFFELNGVSHNKDNYDYSKFTSNNYIKSGTIKKDITALRGWKCEKCGNSEWNGVKIPLEVHHIDGDNTNNNLSNLQLLCPNCHSQTVNYRNLNTKVKEKRQAIPEEKYVDALKTSRSIRQALKKLGLSPRGGNYTKASEICSKYGFTVGCDL